MQDITIARGETLDIPLTISGVQPSGTDCLLAVIRDGNGTIRWERVLSPSTAEDADGQPVLTAVLSMTHAETDALTPGLYRWGLMLFQSAELDAGGLPLDGHPVYVPIASAAFRVVQSIARSDNG